ncbi:MAG: metal-dependent transcriptional regulator, partial [Methylococcales bacterium]|nr:metal-dependent transcriptional regulator [Methylococcales bacterium]
TMPDSAVTLLYAIILIGLGFVLFWPERGLIPRWQRARQLTKRVLSEDALKHIHNWDIEGRHVTLESIAGTLGISLADTTELIEHMQQDALIHTEQGEIHLTPKGRDTALHIIRAHRLWERYLAEETGYKADEWHAQAERYEHTLTPDATQKLSARLGYPTHDPHGDPIPTASGELVSHGGQPLTKLPLDTPARIVHLEDEPVVVFSQLMAEGLYPGQIVRMTESTPERIRFWTNGDEHVLSPLVAANISAIPLPVELEEAADDSVSLTNLELGEFASVTRLSSTCRGSERRRLMDLGIVPGTKISIEMRSPSGEPTAYRIRGALIALRSEQANFIKINRLGVAA